MFERLAKSMGRADLIEDPRFKNNVARVSNNPNLDSIIASEIKARSCDENMKIFSNAGVTAMPVYDIEDILADPHFLQRELIKKVPDAEFGEVPMHNATPRMSETPLEIRWTGPPLGAHSEEILISWLGMNSEEIDQLRKGNVV